MLLAVGSRGGVVVCGCAGQIVWRRHVELPVPSRQTVCGTCTLLLPLVETYCRTELGENCSDLRALMVRFDDEEELESTALGRSLLSLVRDGDDGLNTLSRRIHIAAPPNPFEAVRARLAAVGLAIRGLGPQVHTILGLCTLCAIHKINKMALQCAFVGCRTHRTSFPPRCCLGLALSVVYAWGVFLVSSSALGLHSVHGCFPGCASCMLQR